MKKLFLTLAMVSLVFLFNCSSPMKSYLYTKTTQHTIGGSQGNLISSANVEKFGESCSRTYVVMNFFYHPKGSSIEDAMKNGQITKLAVVDRRSYNILGGILNEECVIAWGE